MTPDSANSWAREAHARRLLTTPPPAILLTGAIPPPARCYADVIDVPKPGRVPARRRQHAARQRPRIRRLAAPSDARGRRRFAGALLGDLRGAAKGTRLR